MTGRRNGLVAFVQRKQFCLFLEEIWSAYEYVVSQMAIELIVFFFVVDIRQELNVLNKKLQGQGQLASKHKRTSCKAHNSVAIGMLIPL